MRKSVFDPMVEKDKTIQIMIIASCLRISDESNSNVKANPCLTILLEIDN